MPLTHYIRHLVANYVQSCHANIRAFFLCRSNKRYHVANRTPGQHRVTRRFSEVCIPITPLAYRVTKATPPANPHEYSIPATIGNGNPIGNGREIVSIVMIVAILKRVSGGSDGGGSTYSPPIKKSLLSLLFYINQGLTMT